MSKQKREYKKILPYIQQGFPMEIVEDKFLLSEFTQSCTRYFPIIRKLTKLWGIRAYHYRDIISGKEHIGLGFIGVSAEVYACKEQLIALIKALEVDLKGFKKQIKSVSKREHLSLLITEERARMSLQLIYWLDKLYILKNDFGITPDKEIPKQIQISHYWKHCVKHKHLKTELRDARN